MIHICPLCQGATVLSTKLDREDKPFRFCGRCGVRVEEPPPTERSGILDGFASVYSPIWQGV